MVSNSKYITTKKFRTAVTSNTKCNFRQLHFLNNEYVGYTATTQPPKSCVKIRL